MDVRRINVNYYVTCIQGLQYRLQYRFTSEPLRKSTDNIYSCKRDYKSFLLNLYCESVCMYLLIV